MIHDGATVVERACKSLGPLDGRKNIIFCAACGVFGAIGVGLALGSWKDFFILFFANLVALAGPQAIAAPLTVFGVSVAYGGMRAYYSNKQLGYRTIFDG
ncbi:hypothetical protein ACFELO_07415 [Oceanicaulis sp. LC35]|uniref:hypothetical protein n=1 Tax=Oceanicaulis sp. LC35 TaxID=3349635 RepID=UPI003F83B8DF